MGQEGKSSELDGGLTLDAGLDQFKALFSVGRCGNVNLGLGWSLCHMLSEAGEVGLQTEEEPVGTQTGGLEITWSERDHSVIF